MLWLYKGSNVYSTVEELVVAVQFSLSIVQYSSTQYISVKFYLSIVSNSYYVAIKVRVVAWFGWKLLTSCT